MALDRMWEQSARDGNSRLVERTSASCQLFLDIFTVKAAIKRPASFITAVMKLVKFAAE